MEKRGGPLTVYLAAELWSGIERERKEGERLTECVVRLIREALKDFPRQR